jgi:hypothetical protein
MTTCYRFAMRTLKWMVAGFFALSVASVTPESNASVSISISYETLIKNTGTVGVMTPVEQYAAWEDKKIYTFTRLHVDEAIAGALGTGSEAWVVTLGGIVGNVGQSVDGEAVLHVGEPSLLFLRPDVKSPGLYIVTARGQGQFHIDVDKTKLRRLRSSNGVGAILPPRENLPSATPAVQAPGLKTSSVSSKSVLLANDMIAGHSLEEVARDVAANWRRLHAQ